MNIQNEAIGQSKSSMCKSCKAFYGNEATQWLCSTCFKKTQIQFKEEKEAKGAVGPQPITTSLGKDQEAKKEADEEHKPVDRKRCKHCNKKVGLLGTECKCGFMFCNSHRLAEDHKCSFNYKQAGHARLEKEIVKVYNGKLQDI